MTDDARNHQIRVIFVCGGNSDRSQMAEAILRREGGANFDVMSAGTWPKDEVDPLTARALDEIGIDARDHVPRKLTDTIVAQADVVVSTCGEEACPVTPPGTRRIYWDLPDPKNEPIDRVRQIRDDIHGRVQVLLRELTAAESGGKPLPSPR